MSPLKQPNDEKDPNCRSKFPNNTLTDFQTKTYRLSVRPKPHACFTYLAASNPTNTTNKSGSSVRKGRKRGPHCVPIGKCEVILTRAQCQYPVAVLYSHRSKGTRRKHTHPTERNLASWWHRQTFRSARSYGSLLSKRGPSWLFGFCVPAIYPVLVRSRSVRTRFV